MCCVILCPHTDRSCLYRNCLFASLCCHFVLSSFEKFGPLLIKSKLAKPKSYLLKRVYSYVQLPHNSSRVSLAGSRQSLSGSRTQLATTSERTTPLSRSITDITKKPERRSVIPTASEQSSSSTSKRESFVETGFLETLKPQFTPGQALTSPAIQAQHSVEEKLNLLQVQQENDELRNQVRDLSEKLATVRQRREEDKERIQAMERRQTQFDQMQEFKHQIMQTQNQLQRDLQRARQEAKDAIEERDRHAEEMSDLAENVELITLDKEVAEEKSEILKQELDAAKERIEELTLDLDILKAEMQDKIGDDTIGDVEINRDRSYELKQLEQQNARLRETLVRLRDLSAHDKHEIQKITKELETKSSEANELHRTKEKLSIKIDELEAQLIDLHEQVDAALGADEMVEQLAEKKMELDDKVC